MRHTKDNSTYKDGERKFVRHPIRSSIFRKTFYIFDSTTISLFTGKTVLVSVYAPGSQNFTGFMEDIDLFTQIKALPQF